VKGPSVPAIFHYASFNLALKSFLRDPGDGRMQPEIRASTPSWGLLLCAILRLNSAHRLEWLARTADGKETGPGAGFGDDALAYFTERLDPEVIRRRAAATLKLAGRNKVFEETAFIGLAIDGTGAGRSTKGVCPLCHPVHDSLPFDAEPHKPGDSEYGAGKRLPPRTVILK
jgi:hypothetical protein